MNLLLDPLPKTVQLVNRIWPIRWRFPIGIQFELLMQDPEIQPEEKAFHALHLYYPEVPPDLDGALDGILWFYRCGVEEEETEQKMRAPKKKARAYDFEQDAARIYSAFQQAFNLDLAEAKELHWWKFRALFQNLPSACDFSKIMEYRVAELSGLPKGERKFYEKMKKQYALKAETDHTRALSTEERDQQMLDYVARRFEEVERQAQKERGE